MNNKALYPGSFNPFHVGHADVLIQAMEIFDQVIICQMLNPEKSRPDPLQINNVMDAYAEVISDMGVPNSTPGFPSSRIKIEIVENDLMVNVAKKLDCQAVIRGLRNSHDLQYEMDLLAWNRQLGLKIPCPMFLANPRYAHISSSGLRSLAKIRR